MFLRQWIDVVGRIGPVHLSDGGLPVEGSLSDSQIGQGVGGRLTSRQRGEALGLFSGTLGFLLIIYGL